MADTLWYYARNQQRIGPVPLAELQRLAASGQLLPTDMVLQQSTQKWITVGAALGLVAPLPQATVARAPFPQARVPVEDGERPLTVIPTRAPPSSRPTLDIIFAVGAIASIPCWAIGELFDAPLLLIAAGSVFLVFASRAIITGSAVDFTGRLRTSRSYRVAGVVVGLLGLAVVFHGSKQLIAKVREGRTQSTSEWQSTTSSGDSQAYLESELARWKTIAENNAGEVAKSRAEAETAKTELAKAQAGQAEGINSVRALSTRRLTELIDAIDEVSITEGRLVKIKVERRDESVVTCNVDGHVFVVGLKDEGKTLVIGFAERFRTATLEKVNEFNKSTNQFQFRASYSEGGLVGFVGGMDLSGEVTTDAIKNFIRKFAKTFPEFLKTVVL